MKQKQLLTFSILLISLAVLAHPVTDCSRELRINATQDIVFKPGDKIVRRNGDVLKYGEIAIVDNTKKKVTIKYLNEYGEEKSTDVGTDRISIVDDATYQKQMSLQNEEIQKHKFVKAEKVSWFSFNTLNYGEVTTLMDANHTAVVTYLNKFGEVQSATVNYLKLNKLSETTYAVFIKDLKTAIERHTFTIGEKISFMDNKLLRVGEVTALNNRNHKATISFLNIFGEEKTNNVPYFELEKVTDKKFNEEKENYAKEMQKYKFVEGEKVNWLPKTLFSKAEIIPVEISSIDILNHTAEVKYVDKDKKQKKGTANFLDLTKTIE